MAGRRKVVLIDAVDADYPPGTVIELTPDDLVPADHPGCSLHEAGLLEALAAAKQLGVSPDEVVIIGVKPKEVGWGLDLSPDIQRLIPKIVDAVMARLEGSGRCQADGVAERNEPGKN
ncbi:MAG: hydrogenase maturation protease [Planctomycetes bacterium]|nr:hydrogenase maturation protease [Planctomycetota bacterium]